MNNFRIYTILIFSLMNGCAAYQPTENYITTRTATTIGVERNNIIRIQSYTQTSYIDNTNHCIPSSNIFENTKLELIENWQAITTDKIYDCSSQCGIDKCLLSWRNETF